MEVASTQAPVAQPKRRKWLIVAVVLLAALGIGAWLWQGRPADEPKRTRGGPIQVVTAVVTQRDVPVRLNLNGSVVAMQAVDIRPQITSIVKAVHIKEGQYVKKGEPLFSLDARTDQANLKKTQAQVIKDRGDLANAERNLQRQRELFQQKFISQAALDTAQNQVELLRGQLAVDQATMEASRVARSYGEIHAPFAGRTGTISVRPGSLVQPSSPALVSITQIDPITVSFTVPERELPALQQAVAKGEVPVAVLLDSAERLQGRLIFVDSAVDTGSGTVRLKAEFPNTDNRLWPGMFVTVSFSARTLTNAATVPVQAVQTGPENKFVYVVGENRQVSAQPIEVHLIQDGVAAISGVPAGTRVVTEGAQNLRPGSTVVEGGDKPAADAPRKGGKSGKGAREKR